MRAVLLRSLVFIGACLCFLGEEPLLAWSQTYRKQEQPACAHCCRSRLNSIDEILLKGIKRGDLPGAVILIVHRDKVIYRKAFGFRALQPKKTPMSADTLFDLASLTKPIATATSLMILLERGKLRLSDRVAKYWPEFGKNCKDKITLEQLLLHTSGLIADNPLKDYQDGKDNSFKQICDLRLEQEPGKRFVYSDVGFIVLGEIVKRLSAPQNGKRLTLHEFATKNIFEPLGMKETTFVPQGQIKSRAAPTEKRNGRWLTGEVHDPRAFLLGGVAGHAGLFATADDLATFARMLLHQGKLNGKRVLSPLTVRLMTRSRAVPGGLRALGWDVDTAFSSNRGELFSRTKGFGHTGFTGTSLWIDPPTQTAVIFLSNRVHPAGKGNVIRLRNQVATLAAAALDLQFLTSRRAYLL